MKILIVDDEKMIRNWLTMLLRQIPDRTFEIAAVSNVDDALAHCANHEVHLVITDITMPQRSGLELLEILRDNYPKVCAAVLSAYDDYQYIRTAMQLGAIDYILKAEMELSADAFESISFKSSTRARSPPLRPLTGLYTSSPLNRNTASALRTCVCVM